MTKIQIQNMLKVQFQSLQKSKTKIFVDKKVFEYNIYSTPLPHLAAPTITKCQQDLIHFFGNPNSNIADMRIRKSLKKKKSFQQDIYFTLLPLLAAPTITK